MTHKNKTSKYIIPEEKTKNFREVSQNIFTLTSQSKFKTTQYSSSNISEVAIALRNGS